MQLQISRSFRSHTMPMRHRRQRQKLFSSFEFKAFIFGALGILSSGSVLSLLLVSIMASQEPYSIPNSLSSIRLAIKRLDKEGMIAEMSPLEQRDLASQVNLVSEIIGRSNKGANRKLLALSIVSESMKAHVDPLLVTAVVKSESSFKPAAISNTGARGLMQLLPSTARYAVENLVAATKDHGDLHKIDFNLHIGIAYLKHLQELFPGNKELPLMAYNWGPGNVLNALKNRGEIPSETKDYAKTILKNHSLWKKELMMTAKVISSTKDFA